MQGGWNDWRTMNHLAWGEMSGIQWCFYSSFDFCQLNGHWSVWLLFAECDARHDLHAV